MLASTADNELLIHAAGGWERCRSAGVATGSRPCEVHHLSGRLSTCRCGHTAVKTASKHSPTGQRVFIKPYPKDNEPRTITVSAGLLEVLSRRIQEDGLGRNDYLFPSVEGPSEYPVSRNTFRTRVWLPAVTSAGLDFNVAASTTFAMPARAGCVGPLTGAMRLAHARRRASGVWLCR